MNCPFEILFENSEFVALFKPAGLHADFGENSTSVAAGIAPLGWELVNRLDFETSGVVLAVKTPEAKAEFKKSFNDKKIRKTYLIVVEGEFAGTREISGYLGNPNRGANRVRYNIEHKKRYQYAVGDFSLVRPVTSLEKPASLLKCTTIFGMRHIVRALASELGFPLVGDRIYGATTSSSAPYPNFILHAETIEFENFKIVAKFPYEQI